MLEVFAPLRGWYGKESGFCSTVQVFAPLRGLYSYADVQCAGPDVFAPLRGLYPKYITKHRKTEEPDGWKIFTLLQ